MNIGIIGCGIVGEACAKGFEHIDHKVVRHDLKLNTDINILLDTEILFICVPTPSKINNSCDSSIVESCINDLIKINYQGSICIKSTVEPGTTKIFSKKYNLDLSFVPEFLKERNAYDDFVNNHDLLAIGTNSESNIKLIIKAHGKLPKNIKILNSTEAEALKYFSNSFNALKIVFANNFYEICKSLNAEYSKILDAYMQRDISKEDYLQVKENLRGYGGQCLPKDVKALINLIEKLNIPLELFKVIDSDNDKLEKTVFEGMRKD